MVAVQRRPSGQVALSPEVKAAIADEVKAQIAAAQAEAAKAAVRPVEHSLQRRLLTKRLRRLIQRGARS